MSRIRTLLMLVPMICTLGCTPEETPIRGIQTRVSLDRTASLVGDVMGVTVEVETPPGYTIELPAPPEAEGPFVSESIQKLAPLEIPGGVRHQLLWTLRPRSLGEHALPSLEVPLVQPDGRVQRLPVGGVPFRVRSVREEVPEREVFFDIRAAPKPTRHAPWAAIAASLVASLLAAGLLAQRRQSRKQAPLTRDPDELVRQTRLDLEAAFEEPDARRLADRLVHVLWPFIEERWQVETSACTPADLPEEVAEPLARILGELEHARFQKTTTRSAVLRAGREARAILSNVARS